MREEVTGLVAEATPYVMAAVGAYGGAVLAKMQDDAAGATVGLGRGLLQRIFGSREAGEPLPEVLELVVADPRDADALGALRMAMRRGLETDAVLLTEVRSMLSPASSAGAGQTVHAGRDAYVAGRDMTINR